jgi:RND family efflux transporter MFP subunit
MIGVNRMRRLSLLALLLVLLAVAAPLAAAPEGTLDCIIEPNLIVAVASPVDGVLETVRVDRGDVVRAGDVLAVLDSVVDRTFVALAKARAEVEANMKSNQARFEFGVRRLVRTEELFKKDLVPLREMDEAETQKVLAEIGVIEAKETRQLAQLELARAQAALAQRTIKSPIDGVVVERVLTAGEFTKQGAIVKLAQIDPLRVEVIAPVALHGRIHLGMRAQVTPEAPFREPLAARVKVVDRVVDAASGTFGVRLELPNPRFRIPAGLKCKVRFLD